MCVCVNRSLEVNEFELHTRFYFHHRINNLRNGMNPYIPHPATD